MRAIWFDNFLKSELGRQWAVAGDSGSGQLQEAVLQFFQGF